MIKRLGIAAILLLLIGIASIFLARQCINNFATSVLSNPQEIIIEVARGSSIKSLSRKLAAQGLIDNPLWFEWYGRLRGDAARIQSGRYLVPADTRVSELMDMLVKGRVQQLSLTLVEGTTVKDALNAIQSHPEIQASQSPLDPEALAKTLNINGNPEGQLFPDTYFFTANTPTAQLAKRAHQRLQSVLAEEWSQRAEDLPYESPYEALIMASIVERETGVPAERGEIAGVFVRRLKKGMRLQTDPTVIYGLGDQYQGNITRKHLNDYTPYNTYRIKGLPPTPIALAGREAIHAALHPKPGTSLYFVARGDGSHQFSSTLEEHNRAVRQYQLKRRKDYRSSPADGVSSQ
ncbi:endolytic transglycosylase MltG [Aestuariirhabdus sp. Z084]|uniref:endolytic transglycosylase MltG n=1 Tax=Aestuariirhabdus haliotis TaxID=2918751 RepID=UPI00201B37BF|nr:endolytic transglycosylase MltG [Aestuariirhabdus haliotis]MCL6414806.1 endolytic transglycosylase MltG [Aestuariirhabdus haliotis]MCL6418738.1 endolytic transglycosylase MltG [Aestuariirhabdus haliotis]